MATKALKQIDCSRVWVIYWGKIRINITSFTRKMVERTLIVLRMRKFMLSIW